MPLMPFRLIFLTLFYASSASAINLNLSDLHEFQLPIPTTLGQKTLGTAIALSDNIAAIAAHPENDRLTGSVYLYNINKNWQLIDEISGSSAIDNFGHQLIIKDDLLIISANKDDRQGKDSGVVYIYQQDTSVKPHQWKQVTILSAPDAETKDQFGKAIAFSDNALYVGAPYHQQGKVYIFTKNASKQWEMTDSIVSTDPQAAQFGRSISIDQQTLVIGAPTTNANDNQSTARSRQLARFAISKGDTVDPGIESGAIYVYEKQENEWQQTARLGASNRESGDRLGQQVIIQNDTIIASLSHKDVWDELGAGVVYTYKKVNHEWHENTALTAEPAQLGGVFGANFAVLDNHILVGAAKTHHNGFNSGHAFLFAQNEKNEWSLIQTQVNATIKAQDHFGLNVALSNQHMLIASKHAVYAFQNKPIESQPAIFYMNTQSLHLNQVAVPNLGVFSAKLTLSQRAEALFLSVTESRLRADITSSTINYSASGQINIPRLALQQNDGTISFYSATLQQISGVEPLRFKVTTIDLIQ